MQTVAGKQLTGGNMTRATLWKPVWQNLAMKTDGQVIFLF